MADGWRDPEQGIWAGSLPAGRILGIDVRLHWTLFALSLFDAVSHSRGLPWWMIPAFMAVWILSIAVHEIGHILMARLCGGGGDRMHLWAFGGMSACSAPPRPLPQFAVAAAGPVANALLWLASLVALRQFSESGLSASLLLVVIGYVGAVNGSLLLFNLIPAYPLDGGRMLRAVLWPLAGRRRAVRWTILIAYVVLAALGFWAISGTDLRLFLIVLMLVVAVVQEHSLVRQGYDPEGIEDWQAGRPFIERWRTARAARAAARAERRADREQAELDRLLAKVSADGLPALSASERRTLQAISQRERERADRG